MQTQRRQKGFTLVELLVVIAIIAILATVSIIGYTQFIKRANMSADQQAVTQMNTLLEGLDVNNEPDDVVDLWTYLNETGLDAEDYKPLTKDHYFFWDESINRILLVDKENKVIFPKAYAEAGKSNSKKWYTLSGTIDLKEPPAVTTVTAEGVAIKRVEIASASDFITTVTDAIKMAGVDEMKLSDDVNMMGASHGSVSLTKNFKLEGGRLDGDNTVPSVISNLVSTEYASVATQGVYANKKYHSGLFGKTEGKAKDNVEILIENVTFDGLVMGNYETGSTGILFGAIGINTTVTLKNVTFKNCTIYGLNKVGLIAGGIYGTLKLDGVNIENCVVNASEGESGKLFGTVYKEGKVEVMEGGCSIDDKTVINTVKYDIHEIVDINGAKYVTRVKFDTGVPTTQTEKISDQTYTVAYRCATPSTIGWFYKNNNGYAAVSDSSYCERRIIEVTSIEQINTLKETTARE
jgi:prepilin-type N-terminal cleavage/methylation domain-containing protein